MSTSGHDHLFDAASPESMLQYLRDRLAAHDLSGQEALAMLGAVHESLSQPAAGQPALFKAYSEVMESLRTEMPDVHEYVVSAWQERGSGPGRGQAASDWPASLSDQVDEGPGSEQPGQAADTPALADRLGSAGAASVGQGGPQEPGAELGEALEGAEGESEGEEPSGSRESDQDAQETEGTELNDERGDEPAGAAQAGSEPEGDERAQEAGQDDAESAEAGPAPDQEAGETSEEEAGPSVEGDGEPAESAAGGEPGSDGESSSASSSENTDVKTEPWEEEQGGEAAPD